MDRLDPATCALAYGPNSDGLCNWDGRPLPTRRTRWCSPECYRAWREAHVWSLARTAALRRSGGRCAHCERRDGVQVHHAVPVAPVGNYGPGCAHHPDRLIVLCPPHHAAAHRNLRAKPGEQLVLIAA